MHFLRLLDAQFDKHLTLGRKKSAFPKKTADKKFHTHIVKQSKHILTLTFISSEWGETRGPETCNGQQKTQVSRDVSSTDPVQSCHTVAKDYFLMTTTETE